MATPADADIIIRLYDLRRESVCRDARKWFANWKPASAHEIGQIQGDATRNDNAYLRQATTYWEMAFSIANCGAVDAELFSKNCGEGILFAVKCAHLRSTFPEAFTRTMAEAEAFIAKHPVAQQKAEVFKKRFA